MYTGEIQKKEFKKHAKGASLLLTFFDDNLKQVIILDVPRKQFNKYKEGDVFREEWKVGWLKFPFYWSWEEFAD